MNNKLLYIMQKLQIYTNVNKFRFVTVSIFFSDHEVL